MTPAQWRLSDRVVSLLGAEAGMDERELAARLGVSVSDLVPVLRVLYRQRRIDLCWSYAVAIPRRHEGRRAA